MEIELKSFTPAEQAIIGLRFHAIPSDSRFVHAIKRILYVKVPVYSIY